MWSLIKKEWRDYRALMYGFLVLPPLVSLALRWLVIGWAKASHTESVHYFVPGFFGLFVVAVAADLIAGDAGSGRIRFLAALPVRPTTVWSTKVLFLVTTSTTYLGYLFAAEWITLGLAGKDLTRFYPDLMQNAPWFAAIACGGAAVLFGSTLLDRSLSAVLAGAAVLAAVVAAILFYDPTRFGVRYRASMLVPAAFVLIPALLAGSYLAFTRGRVHLGSRVRRVVLAIASFLLVATAPAIVSARALESWWFVKPNDTDVRWGVSSWNGVTPDGRWVVATADRYGRGPFGVGSHRAGMFAVRIEDGTVRDLTGLGRVVSMDPGEWYPAPDKLRLSRFVGGALPTGETRLVVDYDLDRGSVTRTRARPFPDGPLRNRFPIGPWYMEHRSGGGRGKICSEAVLVRPEGRTVLPRGWWSLGVVAPWGIAVHRSRRDGGKHAGFMHGVLDLATGEVREIPHRPFLLPIEPDGEVLGIAPKRRGVLAVPIDGGTPRLVLEAPYRTSATSPDGTRFLVATDRGLFRFRNDDATPRRIEGLPDGRVVKRLLWSRDGQSFLALTGGKAWRGTRDGRSVVEFADVGKISPIRFDGERAVVRSYDGYRIFVVDAKGMRRLLPTP